MNRLSLSSIACWLSWKAGGKFAQEEDHARRRPRFFRSPGLGGVDETDMSQYVISQAIDNKRKSVLALILLLRNWQLARGRNRLSQLIQGGFK